LETINGTDPRVILTLDAGGTNFVFSAMQNYDEVVEPLTLPSQAHDLNLSLSTLIDGFTQVSDKCPANPEGISFAFPGPADFPKGIIGDLANLPSFRGGIALGPMLEEKFKLPVFINNDGDLFAYGEALAGYLPWLNSLFEEAGSPRRFQNLVGITLGTGFGGGIVSQGRLFSGDNSRAGEVWLLRDSLLPKTNVEQSISIRAIRSVFARNKGIEFDQAPTPKEIYDLAMDTTSADQPAALEAFDTMAVALGDALCNILTIVDGIAVIGGGLAGSWELFLPKVIQEMNSDFINPFGENFPRLKGKAFNLEDGDELQTFLQGDTREIKVPLSDKKVIYDSMQRVGVGISKLGTSQAIALGAYTYALNALDQGR